MYMHLAIHGLLVHKKGEVVSIMMNQGVRERKLSLSYSNPEANGGDENIPRKSGKRSG